MNKNKNSELISMRISKLPLAMMGLLVLSLVLPGTSNAASTVNVNGIKEAGEYTGTTSGTKSLLWFNDHESIYTQAAGNTNDLDWEINEAALGKFSLNVFFEVPDYARRMIWAKDCQYNGGAVSSACAPLATPTPDPGDTEPAYLRAYQNGSHHGSGGGNPTKSVKMDYGTQTGSEYFRLNDDTDSQIFKTKWQDSPGTDTGLEWATSLSYLLGNGICDTDQCTQFDRTASIEVMWTGLADKGEADTLLASIDNMQLHLSDEARGLPPFIPEVPVPAAFWLFGTALIGFIGFSRRTNLS